MNVFGQVHDSYSFFRSQNLDLDFELIVYPKKAEQVCVHMCGLGLILVTMCVCLQDAPRDNVLLYSSTLRYLQQYQARISTYVPIPLQNDSHSALLV